MDQVKMGKLIAKLRKEKEMTQDKLRNLKDYKKSRMRKEKRIEKY